MRRTSHFKCRDSFGMKLSVEVNEMFAENTKDVNDRSRTKVEWRTNNRKIRLSNRHELLIVQSELSILTKLGFFLLRKEFRRSDGVLKSILERLAINFGKQIIFTSSPLNCQQNSFSTTSKNSDSSYLSCVGLLFFI